MYSYTFETTVGDQYRLTQTVEFSHHPSDQQECKTSSELPLWANFGQQLLRPGFHLNNYLSQTRNFFRNRFVFLTFDSSQLGNMPLSILQTSLRKCSKPSDSCVWVNTMFSVSSASFRAFSYFSYQNRNFALKLWSPELFAVSNFYSTTKFIHLSKRTWNVFSLWKCEVDHSDL